jgi:ATP-binding cassette subfamily F protein uup
LQDYSGTLLLVSHDRAFLDNVVTQTIAAEGNGVWREYVGGYSDWLRQRPAAKPAAARSRGATPNNAPAPRRKMSYKEQRELESLPGDIENLEAEQDALTQKMCSADYHRAGADDMRRDRERAEQLASQIAAHMDRWEELDTLAAKVSQNPDQGKS